MRTRLSKNMQRQRYAGCSASDFRVCSATCWHPRLIPIAAGGGGQLYSLVFKTPPKTVGKRKKRLANAILPQVGAPRPTQTKGLPGNKSFGLLPWHAPPRLC